MTAARNAVKMTLRAYAIGTSSLRAQPDFIVIGGKRCGTTSLFRNLARHPDFVPLFPPAQQIKGAHFFDTNFTKGKTWYRSHFPLRATVARRRSDNRVSFTGEASPYYLFHPHAARRARDCVPDAKLIVLLRNPPDRAFSHYRERVRHGVESLSFEEALEAEDVRLAGEEEKLLADETYYSFAHEHLSYFRQGLYADALERWLQFFPRDRFLFLRSEDMFTRPAAAYDEVTTFLGVAALPEDTFERHNWHPGDPMRASTRAQLATRFADANERLSRLLDMGFPAWD
ncbi:MAG: sulfotransferase domain-containing protein [Actinomycetota bacterium]|nr:sulfotransferase domain-containing protein [Actinomycetota bacterium]